MTDDRLARRRAQNAAAAKRYRDRKRAERQGSAIPEGSGLRAAPVYRPTTPGTVGRASSYAETLRQRRAEIIGGLESVRNPEVTIYLPRTPGRALARRTTQAGQRRQADAIRERADAQRIQNVGRRRREQLRDELDHGPLSERLQEALNGSDQRRFREASRRIAAIPLQALALLFDFEGGQGDYSSAIERLVASPGSRDVDEGLAKLEGLADLAERAGRLYAPSRIGRLSV